MKKEHHHEILLLFARWDEEVEDGEILVQNWLRGEYQKNDNKKIDSKEKLVGKGTEKDCEMTMEEHESV